MKEIEYKYESCVPIDKVVGLYASLGWSAAEETPEIEGSPQELAHRHYCLE